MTLTLINNIIYIPSLGVKVQSVTHYSSKRLFSSNELWLCVMCVCWGDLQKGDIIYIGVKVQSGAHYSSKR